MTKDKSINISFDVNEAYEQTVGPLFDTASDTLIALWDISFGKIDHYREKNQLKRTYELSEFKRELENKVNQIPKEHFEEPTISKVGPALEASKYYFEEEEIRSMFANLIASSMDSRKVNEVYPSFSEIIKQMNKLDAENLKIIYESIESCAKICQINLPVNKGGFRSIFTNLFIENESNNDYDAISSSLSNLSRLGLIEIDYGKWFTNKDAYKPFENTKLFRDTIKTQIAYNSQHQLSLNDPEAYKPPKIVKGIVSITPYGAAFCRICL